MDAKYYIETDGDIFLVRREGALDLPFKREVPFEFDPIAPLPVDGEVWFCSPRLAEHPSDWTGKDHVDGLDDVTPLVREAVHASMPRVVVEGVCVQQGCVLLVKGNRGFTKDRWTLPGGFLRFGEDPTEGLQREIREEIGVDCRIGDLIAVRSKLGKASRLHWILFFYRIAIDGEPIANPDEIAELRFVEVDEACGLLADGVMREVVSKLGRAPKTDGH